MISGRTPREWDENMKFIGRSAELSALDRMYGKNSFEMMILYGRRRVGKTTLLNQFAEGQKERTYCSIRGLRVKTARISLNSEEQCFHILVM